jgi:hypothetical protein
MAQRFSGVAFLSSRQQEWLLLPSLKSRRDSAFLYPAPTPRSSSFQQSLLLARAATPWLDFSLTTRTGRYSHSASQPFAAQLLHLEPCWAYASANVPVRQLDDFSKVFPFPGFGTCKPLLFDCSHTAVLMSSLAL